MYSKYSSIYDVQENRYFGMFDFENKFNYQRMCSIDPFRWEERPLKINKRSFTKYGTFVHYKGMGPKSATIGAFDEWLFQNGSIPSEHLATYDA